MAGAMARRRLLKLAGAAGAALLAACGGPTGETFPPPRTPTPQGTAIYVPPTIGGLPTATAGQVLGTVPPTPRRGSPTPDFLRMLSYIPDDPQLFGGSLVFANPGEVRRLYAYDQVRGPGDLQAQNIPPADYANALGGCYLSEFAGGGGVPGRWRDAFGYDAYTVEREIWAGRLPDALSRLEGTFADDAITAQLQMGGYVAALRSATPYLTIRADNEADLRDPRGQIALGRMNRVAVLRDRLLATPKTAIIEAALDTEARKTPGLDTNANMRALAGAFPNATSLATAPPDAVLSAAAVVRPEVYAQLTREYAPLRGPELLAAGYTDNGTYQRTLHIALVYANPNDANADAAELTKRVTGFRQLRTGRPLIPTTATGVASRVVSSAGRGVLVADLPLLADPPLSRFWLDLWLNGEIFLLLTSPRAAMGTPVPATAGAIIPPPVVSPRPATIPAIGAMSTTPATPRP